MKHAETAIELYKMPSFPVRAFREQQRMMPRPQASRSRKDARVVLVERLIVCRMVLVETAEPDQGQPVASVRQHGKSP